MSVLFRVYQVHNKYDECSIRVITNIVSVLLEYIFYQTLPIMLALCSMLLGTYYASKLCRHNWRKPNVVMYLKIDLGLQAVDPNNNYWLNNVTGFAKTCIVHNINKVC